MSHHAHYIDDILASVGDFLRRAGGLVFFEVRERGLQLALKLGDRPRQETNERFRPIGVLEWVDGGKILRMRSAADGQLRRELVAERAYPGKIEPVQLQQVEVEEMIRTIAVPEFKVRRVAPPVRLT